MSLDAYRCIFCEKTFRVDELDAHFTSFHSRLRNFTVNDGDADYDWLSFRDICPRTTYEEPVQPGTSLLPDKPRDLLFDLSLDPAAMAGGCSEIIGEGGALSQSQFMQCIFHLERALGERATLLKERFINALIKYLCTWDATDKISGTGGVRLEFSDIVLDPSGNPVPTGIKERFFNWTTIFSHFNEATKDYDYKVTPRRITRCIPRQIMDAIGSAEYLRDFKIRGTAESNHFGVDPKMWWVCLSFAANLKAVNEMSEDERKAFMRVASMKHVTSQEYEAFDSRPATGDPSEMRSAASRAAEQQLYESRFGTRATSFKNRGYSMRDVKRMQFTPGGWQGGFIPEE